MGLHLTHLHLNPEETGGIPQFNKIMVDGEEQLGTVWSFPDIFESYMN